MKVFFFFSALLVSGDGVAKKKQKLNFDDCRVVDELGIPAALVQMTVDETEIQRRIQSFVDQKQVVINQNNLRDFIDGGNNDSCARVVSNVYRIKDSKGHLRIRRTKNETGPMDVKSISDSPAKKIFSSINERLENAEEFLNLAPNSIPKDIYHRLKLIEDQIMHLQTVSPEYSQFVTRMDSMSNKKAIYTIGDLDKMIESMESKKC